MSAGLVLENLQTARQFMNCRHCLEPIEAPSCEKYTRGLARARNARYHFACRYASKVKGRPRALLGVVQRNVLARIAQLEQEAAR